ncbi:MAG: hypothetical protein ACK56F_20650, partial [bacterium]
EKIQKLTNENVVTSQPLFQSQVVEEVGESHGVADVDDSPIGKYCVDCGDVLYSSSDVILCKICNDALFHVTCQLMRPEVEQDNVCSESCRHQPSKQ